METIFFCIMINAARPVDVETFRQATKSELKLVLWKGEKGVVSEPSAFDPVYQDLF